MLKSFRARILGAFLLLISLLVALLWVNFIFVDEWFDLNEFSERIYKARSNFVKADRALSTFVLSETTDTSFYVEGDAPALREFRLRMDSVEHYLDDIRRQEEARNARLDSAIIEAQSRSALLRNRVKELRHRILERGFWDYGTEGEMREYVHLLEDEQMISRSSMLSLRRREKDYLLRGDPKYVEMLSKEVDALLSEELFLTEEARETLLNYRRSFMQLVNFDQHIGLRKKDGLAGEIFTLQKEIDELTASIVDRYSRQEEVVYEKLAGIWIGTFAALFVIGITLSYFLTKYLSRDIGEVSAAVAELTESKFEQVRIDLKDDGAEDEIGKLRSNLIRMVEHMRQLVTDLRKQTEEANQASEAKTRFLANMSHEIRTPLNGIVGMVDMMNSTSLSDTQKEYLQIIKYSSDNLLAVISDILDYSKIDAGTMKISEEPFDLSDECGKLMTMLRPAADKKKLSLHLDIQSNVPRVVKGDPLRIRQVLMNLVNNAIKFTEEGSIFLKVSVTDAENSESWIRFDVKDTGIGIPKDRQAELFEAFVQVDTSRTRRFGGTGLGLSICKEIVNLMGGEITVDSEPGFGSTFSVLLPLKIAALPQPTTTVHAPKGELKELSVLLAEDNLVNQTVVRLMLEQQNCRVVIAANGQEAVEVLREASFDLVLMDLQMPVLDGYGAMSQIKGERLHLNGNETPVYALTANATIEEKEKTIAAGMHGFLTKPLQQEQLKKLLDTLRSAEGK